MLSGDIVNAHETRWEIMKNFFKFGHEKSKHDGASAVIKWALTHEQLKTEWFNKRISICEDNMSFVLARVRKMIVCQYIM